MHEELSIQIFEVSPDDSDFQGEYPTHLLPGEARSSVVEALQRKETHYVNVPGITPLREAIAVFLTDLGINTPMEKVLVTAGEQEARFLTLHSLLQDGYNAAVPAVVSPGVQRVISIKSRQAQTIPVDRSKGMLPDLASLEQTLKSGSNLIYLESPNRLTGYVYEQEEVQQIAALLESYDALSIWDQSTAPAVIGKYSSLISFAPERVLAFGPLWPGLGLDTWQLGYITASDSFVQSLTKLKQAISICTSSPLQWAAVGASKVFAEKHAALKFDMEAIRQEVLTSFQSDERVLIGSTTNILAIDLGETAPQALQRLEADGFHVTNGSVFGAPGILRIVMKPNPETLNVLSKLIEGVSA